MNASSRHRVVAALFLLAALAPPARAQLIGDFAIPSIGIIDSPSTLGAWTFLNQDSGFDDASLDTTDAPDSITFGMGSEDVTNFSFLSITAPESGTLSFAYSFSASVGGNNPVGVCVFTLADAGNSTGSGFTTSGSILWNVQAGDLISISNSATGGILMTQEGSNILFFPVPSSSSLTISNFSFAPIAVPEPATCSIGIGLAALASAYFRRKKGLSPSSS